MTCLLAVDVGNTNTVLGVFRGTDLVAHFRIETNAARTSDELAVLVRSLLELQGFAWGSIDAGIVSSVLPPAVLPIQRFFKQYVGAPALVDGPGIKTGKPILYENPREVGADRIVNSVAAYEQVRGGCIVVDFGTATTWDVVSPRAAIIRVTGRASAFCASAPSRAGSSGVSSSAVTRRPGCARTGARGRAG
jgi:type III pantothenate kinase